MKNYVVAIISFFENDIKQFKVQADDEFSAVKLAMVEFCDSEEGKQMELDYQNSEDYAKTLTELCYDEMDYSIVEVSSL